MFGLALHGQVIGRDGALSIVALSTPSSVFLVDCVQMEPRAVMQRGLGSLLSDPAYTKVMHDCRQPSDLLWHQFDVKLTNVYDTLAGHVIFCSW